MFTIHGNHDDPTGSDNLSAVDLLSTCSLVNYFGKTVLDPKLFNIHHDLMNYCSLWAGGEVRLATADISLSAFILEPQA